MAVWSGVSAAVGWCVVGVSVGRCRWGAEVWVCAGGGLGCWGFGVCGGPVGPGWSGVVACAEWSLGGEVSGLRVCRVMGAPG